MATLTTDNESFPLSPTQQGMLFHHLKEPHSGVDIEQLVIHLHERVDPRRLQMAWEWLARRHDVLRTHFVWEGVETPIQQVTCQISLALEPADCCHLSRNDQREKLRSFLEIDRITGFDLSCAPLFRLHLFRWEDDFFSLVWTFHHSLLDGRCYPVLLREVFEAYQELKQGGISDRPSPHPYRKYIDWISTQDFAAADVFWRDQLKGFSTPTPLTVDRRAPLPTQVRPHGEVWQHLDSRTTLGLHRLATDQGLSINSIVMGAWAILLHRYCGEEDIVFGATRACRKSTIPNAEETIGLFINTIPVRVAVRDDDSALEVIRRLRKLWIDLRPYENTPLARVKSASQVSPGLQLFDSLVVFENYRLDRAMRSLGGAWESREVELHELTNFPVTWRPTMAMS